MDRTKIVLASASGLLLTASFPKFGISWLAWFALVPLLISLRDVSSKSGFQLGFLAGSIHYLTLVYWLIHTMQSYGHLPLVLAVTVLLLLSFYLAVFIALFSAVLVRTAPKPIACFFMIPVLWVMFEYVRSFLFSGFPWELLGYSQYNRLTIIQASDILGVYGISFLIALSNAAIFLGFLFLARKIWLQAAITKQQMIGITAMFTIIVALFWFYGNGRIRAVDDWVIKSPSVRVSIIQGNIDQTKKWNPAFQKITTEKYINLSLSARDQNPDLVVWPETATPFYFLYNTRLTGMVKRGVKLAGTSFLIGSPSFTSEGNILGYYNSAYLLNPDGRVTGKYDKAHLVPFGEYVPFKKWVPFLGKIVENVGDFKPGRKGDTIRWGKRRLGVQICFEVIFPKLSRAMVQNGANLLVNITNDAWFGRTSAPYQHFSMAVFRAVENKRSLIRSANTGFSGFIDPVGRIISKTPLYTEAVSTQSVPVINQTTFYTRFGDLFAMACLLAGLAYIIRYGLKA